MSKVRALVVEGVDALDRQAIGWILRRVSLDREAEAARLRSRGWPFYDPLACEPVRIADVDATAQRLIDEELVAQAGRRGGGGAWGWVRLLQRLAWVYGHDLSRPRGRAWLMQAVAAMWAVDLPAEGVVDTRVTSVVRGQGVAGGLVRQVALARLKWIARAQRRTPEEQRAAVERARRVLRSGARAPNPSVVEGEEVRFEVVVARRR